MPGPIDIIVNTRLRLQRIAAIRGFMLALLPALVAFALTMLIEPIGGLTFSRWGYALSAGRAMTMREFLAFVGGAFIVVGAVRALAAWRRADDFVGAAEQVDSRIGAHQQIVTLATLSNPADARVAAGVPRSAPMSARQSPLFPILLKRASALLAGFDPNRAFPLEVGEPLKRSSIFAGIFAAIMIVATLGLVRPPSPLQAEAARLNKIADEIARIATTPDDTALAERVRDAASALENPSLPQEQKIARLEAVKEELGKRSESSGQQRSASGFGSGKGNSKNGKGSGEGTAEAQASASGGSGKGEGSGGGGSQAGKNEGAAGSSSSNEQGAQNNDQNGKAKDKQNIELQNELAKDEAKVEAPNAQLPGSSNSPGSDKSLPGPIAGANPNQKGPGANPDLPGNIPEQGAKGDKNMPSSGNTAGQDRGTGLGDTHLGEFPTAGKAQRYLKPGEGGSASIKDARYVTFKIPGAPVAGASGRAVLDSARPAASTPYVNAPLAATKDDAPPDERQLIPPRYRDLIH